MSKQTKADELREKGDSSGLIQLMYQDTDWLDGLEAAETLALLGKESGVDYLIQCLQDSQADVREVTCST
jgi:hypothetical protein